MSLKFAAVGSLTVLSPFRLPARGGDRARKVVLGESYKPLLAMLGLAGSAEQPRPSSKDSRRTRIAHRVHIGFRADAVIALGDLAPERSPAGHNAHRDLMLVIVSEGDRRALTSGGLRSTAA